MTLPFGMRLYLMIFLIGMASMTLGQATYFLTGGAAAGVTENNYAELKLPAAYEVASSIPTTWVSSVSL